MLTTPREAIELIKHFEGLRLHAYDDGVGVMTIGYGHTKGVKPGDVITETQADKLLRQDLRHAERAVSRFIKAPLTPNQYGALVSFTFNLGSGALQASTLRRKLNRHDYQGAAKEFNRWVYAGGRKLKGLIRRRWAERRLFEKESSYLQEENYEEIRKHNTIS